MDLVLDVVGWVHVSGGRLLAVRARARDRLYLPGGKREPGEDDWTALSREVREELGVQLDEATFQSIGVVEAPAHDVKDLPGAPVAEASGEQAVLAGTPRLGQPDSALGVCEQAARVIEMVGHHPE